MALRFVHEPVDLIIGTGIESGIRLELVLGFVIRGIDVEDQEDVDRGLIVRNAGGWYHLRARSGRGYWWSIGRGLLLAVLRAVLGVLRTITHAVTAARLGWWGLGLLWRGGSGLRLLRGGGRRRRCLFGCWLMGHIRLGGTVLGT
jgi:hypothetical protein